MPLKRHRDDPDPLPRRRPSHDAPGPVPTLAQLRRESCWLWLSCLDPACGNCTAIALAPFLIRWGPDASSDLLRTRVRCSVCAQRGSSITTPSNRHASPFPPDHVRAFYRRAALDRWAAAQRDSKSGPPVPTYRS